MSRVIWCLVALMFGIFATQFCMADGWGRGYAVAAVASEGAGSNGTPVAPSAPIPAAVASYGSTGTAVVKPVRVRYRLAIVTEPVSYGSNGHGYVRQLRRVAFVR